MIHYLRSLLDSAVAVGTVFGQLFRGIGQFFKATSRLTVILIIHTSGQVGGVAISAALFQSILNTELHKRIHRPDAEEVGVNFVLTSFTRC